jgi:hypothetical protein
MIRYLHRDSSSLRGFRKLPCRSKPLLWDLFMTQVTSVNILESYDCPNKPFGRAIIDPCTLHSDLTSNPNASHFRSLTRSPPALLFAFFFRCSNFKIPDRRKPGNSILHEGERPPVPTPFLPPRRPRRTVQALLRTVLRTLRARAPPPPHRANSTQHCASYTPHARGCR